MNLIAHPEKSVGPPDLNGNLIVQGDNLLALEALRERYLGKVDCVFIDPPYNTGNKGWTYNDDVSSPIIKAWLKEKDIDIDSMNRSDRWRIMMEPRLRLLHEMLSDKGVIFVCIDDYEFHHLRLIMDEIFGAENFQNTIVVENDPRARTYSSLSATHEYVVCYSKKATFKFPELLEKNKEFPLQDSEGGFALHEIRNSNTSFNSETLPSMYYPVWVNPISGFGHGLHEISLEETEGWTRILPQESSGIKCVWRWGVKKANEGKNTVLFAKKVNNEYGYRLVKKYRGTQMAMNSVWTDRALISDKGTLVLKQIFQGTRIFAYPKTLALVERILSLVADDAVVLDSFAGSGTTAHAIIEANRKDGGTRKFILVEMEDHIANDVTAERIRRVINGYTCDATQRTELMNVKLSLGTFRNAHKVNARIDAIDTIYGGSFDAITKTMTEDRIMVHGEHNTVESVKGIASTFTYCTLDRI